MPTTTDDLDTAPPVVSLAAAPTSLGQLIDPDAVQGARWTGPLLSGPMDQAAGIAVLQKRAKFTSANGSFSIPIVLPASAIPLAVYTQIQQSFNGLTPTLKIEVTQGGATLCANIDLSAAPGLVTTPITGNLTSNWTFFLTVALGTVTQGKATVMINYSVPALVFPQ
jgi:hypothetical protein